MNSVLIASILVQKKGIQLIFKFQFKIYNGNNYYFNTFINVMKKGELSTIYMRFV